MTEQNKSIWHSDFDTYWRVIPINTVVKADGHLVMGAGLAKQAAERYPFLPAKLGNYYRNRPASLLYSYEDMDIKLIAFPTKIHWSQMSDLSLIERCFVDLKAWVDELRSEAVLYKVVLPRLGCGLGGLNWDDVKPLVEKYFGDDDNFIIASL